MDLLTADALVAVVLATTLVILSVIDLRSLRLPDALTLPLIAAGLLLPPWSWPDWIERAAGAIVGYGVLMAVAQAYRHTRGRAGLGGGDAKLFSAAGAWVGVFALPAVLLLATAAALVAVLVLRLRGTAVAWATAIPFGPFLALGFWCVWWFGSPL
jgi:prepilin signal peptidase PulO-like enzyme (type II secretory pathway)